MMHIIGAMAQFERELIKERVSAGMHLARERVEAESGDLEPMPTPIKSVRYALRMSPGARSPNSWASARVPQYGRLGPAM